jgi:hypothetical protein
MYNGKLYRHYSVFTPSGTVVPRSNFYGVQYNSFIKFVVNDNPANSKSFQAVGYEGNSGWQVSRYESDLTGKKITSGYWSNTFDQASGVRSYYEGEYVISQSTAYASQASTNTIINLGNISGLIPVGALVTGDGVPDNTTIVSYTPSTAVIVVSQNVNIAQFALLNFYLVADRSLYNTAFNTTTPALPKYYSGFNLKENKYVANLINASRPTDKEINFGNKISGIKGFYANVTLSTDSSTDVGGEKQLFNVTTTYTSNNGY